MEKQLHEISKEMWKIVEKAPKNVIRNILWDITTLHYASFMLNTRLKEYVTNPDIDTYLAFKTETTCYFCSTWILLSEYIWEENFAKKIQLLEDLCNKIVEFGLSVTEEEIIDYKKINKMYEGFSAVERETRKVWKAVVSEWNIKEQMCSFKDRDVTPYVKHIMGYTRPSEAKAPIVPHFINTFKECFKV